jgi:hypothetical protein
MKMELQGTGCECELNLAGSRQGAEAEFCEHCKGSSGSMKGE